MPYTPLCTEFKAQLRRAGITQVEFAKRYGLTFKAVNYWCNGGRKVPMYAWSLARASELMPKTDISGPPEEPFYWPEIFDTWDIKRIKKIRARLAKLYHPDHGGSVELMKRVNAAYDEAMADNDPDAC